MDSSTTARIANRYHRLLIARSSSPLELAITQHLKKKLGIRLQYGNPDMEGLIRANLNLWELAPILKKVTSHLRGYTFGLQNSRRLEVHGTVLVLPLEITAPPPAPTSPQAVRQEEKELQQLLARTLKVEIDRKSLKVDVDRRDGSTTFTVKVIVPLTLR